MPTEVPTQAEFAAQAAQIATLTADVAKLKAAAAASTLPQNVKDAISTILTWISSQ